MWTFKSNQRAGAFPFQPNFETQRKKNCRPFRRPEELAKLHADFGHIEQEDAKNQRASFRLRYRGGQCRARDLTVNVMGSGKANLGKLSPRNIKVTIAGGSDAAITPTEEVKITIMGSGSVRLLTRRRKSARS